MRTGVDLLDGRAGIARQASDLTEHRFGMSFGSKEERFSRGGILRLIPFFVALASLAVSIPTATAQGDGRQTPANAQRFLQLTLPGVRFHALNPDYAHQAPGGFSTFRSVGEATDENCTMPFNYLEESIAQVLSGAIGWDRVREVSQEGARVIVSMTGWRGTLHLPSEQTAARVAYAMEFLRVHCDPASSTGF